jgi:hypothetical protein
MLVKLHATNIAAGLSIVRNGLKMGSRTPGVSRLRCRRINKGSIIRVQQYYRLRCAKFAGVVAQGCITSPTS